MRIRILLLLITIIVVATNLLVVNKIKYGSRLFEANVEALSYGEIGNMVDCLPVNFDIKCSFTVKFADGTYHVYSINRAIRYYLK